MCFYFVRGNSARCTRFTMEIQKLLSHYAKQPQLKALAKALENKRIKTVGIDGLAGSSCPLVFASIANRLQNPVVFILRDADEAGYFYHDLMQLGAPALFFPSSYKRAVKYGQRDAANEILRTRLVNQRTVYQTRMIPMMTPGPSLRGRAGGEAFLSSSLPILQLLQKWRWTRQSLMIVQSIFP